MNSRIQTILASAIFLFCVLSASEPSTSPYVIVLGTAQDGGLPHAGCIKQCCENSWDNPDHHKKVSSLGIVDPKTGKSWMIDATPDLPAQLNTLTGNHDSKLDGIFLTHAHIGHYTGLVHLGREVMGSKKVNVFAMPRMRSFLEKNGPWNQLIELNNISINSLRQNLKIQLTDNLSIESFLIPHRDEYSETVGYRINGSNQSLVYIPDIDKWSKWEKNIKAIIKESSFALVDGTFYADGEIPNRSIAEIPHPFVVESMALFGNLSKIDRNKIHFIHMNHTNPLHNPESTETNKVQNKGFNIAQEGQIFPL